MESAYKNCQSCGMPLKKDPKVGGTSADGAKSTAYCSYCFQNGAFYSPNMTVKEMQVLVKGKLKGMGMPGLVAWFFCLNIPRLARWKK